MVEYLLNKLCNLFGYTVIPVVKPYQTIVKCTKDDYDFDNGCECTECMPW
jgi:hypothetical protein